MFTEDNFNSVKGKVWEFLAKNFHIIKDNGRMIKSMVSVKKRSGKRKRKQRNRNKQGKTKQRLKVKNNR